jgi:hypothetical protein
MFWVRFLLIFCILSLPHHIKSAQHSAGSMIHISK